ncbi:MAG TPA: prolyl oligopeptidase family serine peptidase [Anaerolineae bacterium]|nr:prolyl oligopeptidase family serine peptidase [Anaerolineae bacterium]
MNDSTKNLEALINTRLVQLLGSNLDTAGANITPHPNDQWQAASIWDRQLDCLIWTIKKSGPDAKEKPSEQIHNVYPTSIAWLPDGSGFYYDYLLPFTGQHALYYHRCGTSQQADICLLYEPTQPNWYYQPYVSPNGRWLAVSILNHTATNRLRIIPLFPTNQPPIELIDHFTGRYDLLDWQEDRLLLRAITPDTPHGRLLTINLPHPTPTEQITCHDGLLLDAVSLKEGWITNRLDDTGVTELCYQTNNHQTIIPLPGLGTVDELTSNPTTNQIQFTYSDYTRPAQRYRWQPSNSQPELIGELPTLPFDPADFVTHTAQIPSTAGVTVPIFYAHKRTLSATQPKPTLLTAYGGLGTPLLPRFAPDVLAWLEMGGLFVSVCARGGNEKGAAWHKAAVGQRKQHTFDDVLATARWLITTQMTTATQLGLWGTSNGGLTAGVCLTQAPDLFGAVVIESGLLDMLNYHRLGQGTNWLAEYGSPDDPTVRETLAAYSPLHNLTPRPYPATLITTSNDDPRVGEAHSLRFAQALQTAQTGSAPITLRIYPGSGHGVPLDQEEWVTQTAVRLTFLAHHLGLAT